MIVQCPYCDEDTDPIPDCPACNGTGTVYEPDPDVSDAEFASWKERTMGNESPY